MKKFLILLGIFCITLPVSAINWFKVDEKNYIDFDSLLHIPPMYLDNLEFRGREWEFWVKRLNNNDIPNYNGQRVWFIMAKNHINCSNRYSNILSLNVYNLKGQVINTYDGNLGKSAIIPGTYMDFYYQLFCEYIPNKTDEEFLKKFIKK